jgi:hypothetical protein
LGCLQEAVAAELADVHRLVVGSEEGSHARPAEDSDDIAASIDTRNRLRGSRFIMVEEELASVCGLCHEVMEERGRHGHPIYIAVVEQARAAAFTDELGRSGVFGEVPGSRGGAGIHAVDDAILQRGKVQRFFQRRRKILRSREKILRQS